jgi:hypothetical protein
MSAHPDDELTVSTSRRTKDEARDRETEPPDEPSDTGVLGGVDEANESLDEPEASLQGRPDA